MSDEQVKLAHEWFASCDQDERAFIQTLLTEVEEQVRNDVVKRTANSLNELRLRLERSLEAK